MNPNMSHFHPYRQATQSHRHPHLSSSQLHQNSPVWSPYWVPQPRSSARERRHSQAGQISGTQDNDSYLERVRQFLSKGQRALASSRGHLYTPQPPPVVPPTPWLQTIPLPEVQTQRALPKRTPQFREKRILLESPASSGWSPNLHLMPQHAQPWVLPPQVEPPVVIRPMTVLDLALIDNAHLLWDIRNTPVGSSFTPLNAPVRPTTFVRPNLKVPALSPDIRTLSISFDAPRASLFKKDWGHIVVRATTRSSGNDSSTESWEPITVFDLMDAIYKYFSQDLTTQEIALVMSSNDSVFLRNTTSTRMVYTGRSREIDARFKRVDLLDSFQFGGLQVDMMSGNWCHLHLRLGD